MKARTDQAHTVIIGEARSPVGVSLGLRLIGDEEVATVTLTQHDKTVTLYVADQAHAAQIAAAIQGHPPLAAEAPRAEAKATAMTDYQLVPLPPTPEMVSAAEDAYMPFGDMELAIRMAILAAPAVQGELVAWQLHTPDGRVILNKEFPEWADGGDGYKITPLYTAPQPAEQQPCPEGIREGAPYDDPAFESLCREHEVWGTAAAAQCAVFWRAGKRAAEQQPAPDVAGLVEAASAALDEIEAIMREAYNSAEPVCCGRGGAGGCCGSPEPEWSEIDQNTIGRLWPHQRALTAALAAHRQGGEE